MRVGKVEFAPLGPFRTCPGGARGGACGGGTCAVGGAVEEGVRVVQEAVEEDEHEV